ncbi:MAG TPA: methyl-accepting chemotaxis protein [Candidatus Didemnitutus sp.]|nr:methyl-accepting chemotaxis protein [Candidatus Didemnitutus sp.]
MTHWTIGKRITAGGLLLLATLSGVVVFSLFGLRALDHRIESIQSHVLPGISAIGMANSSFMNCYSSLLIGKETKDEAARLQVVERANGHLAQAKEQLDIYNAAIESPEDRANFTELLHRLDDYLKVRAEYVTLLKEGKLAEATVFVTASLEPYNAKMRECFGTIIRWNANTGHEYAANMSAVSKRTMSGDIILSVIGLVLSLGCGFLLLRSVTRALVNLSGNLTAVSAQLSSSAAQVASASDALAQGSTEQAASLEETSASLEEMASITKQNSEGSLNAKKISSENRESADRGFAQMEQMRAAMGEIKASSHEIAKIIKTIDEIAFQTNILALNAAVEAARAGEAGAGFAVVAEEVRALAQRSAQAAKETAAKIEDAISKSDRGAQISEAVAGVLHQITDKTREVDGLVASIADASQEQSQGISQLNVAVGQMDKVTQDNASSAEETSSAAKELSLQAESLSAAVAELQKLAGQTHSTPIESATPPSVVRPTQPTPKRGSRLQPVLAA